MPYAAIEAVIALVEEDYPLEADQARAQLDVLRTALESLGQEVRVHQEFCASGRCWVAHILEGGHTGKTGPLGGLPGYGRFTDESTESPG